MVIINVYTSIGFVMVTKTVKMDLMNHKNFVVSRVRQYFDNIVIP